MNDKKITLINFENHRNFIGRKVQVDISCYSGGMCYPDDNILIGMNEGNYYFKSDEGTEDEQFWHWHTDKEEDKDCSIQVWDYEEYKAFYEKQLNNK